MAKSEEKPERKKSKRTPMSPLMRVVTLIDRSIRSLDTEAERRRAFRCFAAMVDEEAPLFKPTEEKP